MNQDEHKEWLADRNAHLRDVAQRRARKKDVRRSRPVPIAPKADDEVKKGGGEDDGPERILRGEV